MCIGIKDIDFVRKQYLKAAEENIEIIEIEFTDSQTRFRDRWTVKRILDEYEEKGRI